MKDAARATHSLAGSVDCPRAQRSLPAQVQPVLIDASRSRGESVVRPAVCYAGILKFSPLLSAAQAMRAFFAAMATTARQ